MRWRIELHRGATFGLATGGGEVIDKAYCRRCGAECDAWKIITGYSGTTGKPLVDEVYRCRRYRWWDWIPVLFGMSEHFHRHEWTKGKVIEERKAGK